VGILTNRGWLRCVAQNKNDRIIDILTATCAVHNVAIVSNQHEITDSLFRRQSVADPGRWLIPIRLSAGGVELLPPVDKDWPHPTWQPVGAFLDACSLEMFVYFDALLKLCAELCLGRYQVAIREVAEAFPRDAVLHLLYQPSLLTRVRQSRRALCLGRASNVGTARIMLFSVPCARAYVLF
jgi:hypothetical protein